MAQVPNSATFQAPPPHACATFRTRYSSAELHISHTPHIELAVFIVSTRNCDTVTITDAALLSENEWSKLVPGPIQDSDSLSVPTGWFNIYSKRAVTAGVDRYWLRNRYSWLR
jgi:hypothetical protein